MVYRIGLPVIPNIIRPGGSMNRKITDLFKGTKVKVIEQGIYPDTGNKYCRISINGRNISTRFNSFVNVRCKGGYTDYQRDRFVIASDDYMKDNTIQVFGNTFQIEERAIQKGEKRGQKYLAIIFNGSKIGYFINEKQRCCFNNVCI